MSEFDLLATAADGMTTQRALLDVAARNVAAAQASTVQHPYHRLVARFAAVSPEDAFERGLDDGEGPAGDAFSAVPPPAADRDVLAAETFAGTDDDTMTSATLDDVRAPRTAFAGAVPSGETADALTEMIAVLDAQRAYEANASVFDAGKRIAERTIDVGRF